VAVSRRNMYRPGSKPSTRCTISAGCGDLQRIQGSASRRIMSIRAWRRTPRQGYAWCRRNPRRCDVVARSRQGRIRAGGQGAEARLGVGAEHLREDMRDAMNRSMSAIAHALGSIGWHVVPTRLYLEDPAGARDRDVHRDHRPAARPALLSAARNPPAVESQQVHDVVAVDKTNRVCQPRAAAA
jgi:hypothetical protein